MSPFEALFYGEIMSILATALLGYECVALFTMDLSEILVLPMIAPAWEELL